MTEPKYNLEGIRRFVGGDEKAVSDMVKVFLESIPDTLHRFNEVYQKQDYSGLAFYAHKIKASIDILNIEELKNDIRLIEHNAKGAKNLEEIPELKEKVNQILTEVIKELRNEKLY